MTYQVSYCIYTAATVETEELKRASTQQEREDAAMRLAAAFRILQQEASHTPGSGRSLDTIRRLLSTAPLRATNVASHSDHPQPPVLGQNVRSHQANQQQLATFDSPTRVNRPEDTNSHDAHILSSMGRSTSYNNNNGTNGPPRLASGTASVYENSFLPMDVTAWEDEFSLGGTDTGAGFHPDAFPWGVAGPVLRNSGSSSFAGNGMVWPPIAQSEGLQ